MNTATASHWDFFFPPFSFSHIIHVHHFGHKHPRQWQQHCSGNNTHIAHKQRKRDHRQCECIVTVIRLKSVLGNNECCCCCYCCIGDGHKWIVHLEIPFSIKGHVAMTMPRVWDDVWEANGSRTNEWMKKPKPTILLSLAALLEMMVYPWLWISYLHYPDIPCPKHTPFSYTFSTLSIRTVLRSEKKTGKNASRFAKLK